MPCCVAGGCVARVFQELLLIEQWGNGVRRIFCEARVLGLPEPEILEIGMRVRSGIYLAQAMPVDKVTGPVRSPVGSCAPGVVRHPIIRIQTDADASVVTQNRRLQAHNQNAAGSRADYLHLTRHFPFLSGKLGL